MYHMVNEPETSKEARYACPPSRFGSHMQALLQAGYKAVSPQEVESHLRGEKSLPEKAVLVSIDDGFMDNYENAFPILRQYRVPAIIFIATSRAGGHNDWMAGKDYPSRRMLTWEQIREMQAAGIHFGGHTMNHPHLSELDHDAALAEIAGCKKALEDELGPQAKWFAYPYGDLSEDTPGVVQEAGFDFACTTRSGFNQENTPPLLLRRLEIYGTDPAWKVLQKLRFGTNEASLLGPLRYYLGRIAARLLPKSA